MFEEFKTPGILKHIPMPLIRSLPSIYYYNRFRKDKVNEKIKNFFESNINYLDEALVYISNRMEIHQFKEIARSIYTLKKENKEQFSIKFTIAIEKLACNCECNDTKLSQFIKSEKSKFSDMYLNNVSKLLITILNMQIESKNLNKIVSILKNNCNYNTQTGNPEHSDFSDKILHSDLVIFNSTMDPKIHQLIDSLTTYKKPGIALAPLVGNSEQDRISLRHGNQLKRKGFHVIIKGFTPIRLFTSIDREFLKYNLALN